MARSKKQSVFGGKPSGLRQERMRAQPLWAEGTFRNTNPAAKPGIRMGSMMGLMGEYVSSGAARAPKGALPSQSPLPDWARPPETGFRTTWLGHSTVLLELDGARVLTDPVWGLRASPWTFAGPKRFMPVPATIAQLPPLDAVLISHDHYDHLDYPTILELAKLQVPFFTSLGVGAHLEAWGIPPERITELAWWESARVPNTEVQLTAAPSQHFSGRSLATGNATLWSSFVIKGPKHCAFFSGDTGLTDEYAAIRDRLGPFDLVMLEVGAYHPAWGSIHLGPENALKAHALLGSGTLLPVHWGTFNLALHAWDEPAETLLALAQQQGARLVMPTLGATFELPRVESVDPWWRRVI